jgi:hypothetical protein
MDRGIFGGRDGGRRQMKRVDIASAKLNVVFREGELPAIDPADPDFVLVLGGLEIVGKVNPKAARKPAAWAGGVVLQGRLIVGGGKLVLAEAGSSWIDPKAQAGSEAATGGGGQ